MSFDINVHVYLHNDPAERAQLDRIEHHTAQLTIQGVRIMADVAAMNAKLDELAASENQAHADVATAFADLIAALAAAKAAGGATPAELDAMINKAQPVVDALKALDDAAKAADPGAAPPVGP